MLSKTTLAGIHNYTNGSIWDNLNLPAGIDSNTFIAECLRQASEFPLLYPDADFMTYQIGVFSTKWYHNFERWFDAYTEEYNALYNVDVSDIHSESATNNESSYKHDQSMRQTLSGGQTAGTTTTVNSKAAYDANTFQNVAQDSNSSSLSTSESNSESYSTSESMSMTSDHNIYYTDTKYGNQGVTMAQEMLLAEFNAWYFNLYQHMAEIFVNEFCICIYQ